MKSSSKERKISPELQLTASSASTDVVSIQYDDAPLVCCHLFFYLNGGNTLLCLNLTWIRTDWLSQQAFPVAFSLDALSTWIYDIFSIINPPIFLSVYHHSMYLSNICPCLPIYIYLYFFFTLACFIPI